jgi:hypothetical protein
MENIVFLTGREIELSRIALKENVVPPWIWGKA